MNPWFFAPPEAWSGDSIELDAEESHHATKVLRLQPPTVLTVFDGAGRVARAALAVTGARARLEVLEVEVRKRPKPHLVVYQSAAKSGKLDDAVERLAELGVAEFHAFTSERSVARWDASKADRSQQRWATIARSAAKQSRNPHVLNPSAGASWAEMLSAVADEPMSVTLWEEASLPLRAALAEGAERVALVVGPEGGLTQSEAEALADAGSPLVSLGPQILRTENAAVVACSALLFHFGLIG
jgi:16S rRNA (uracil1498-N3)-methyltransferase